MHGVRTQKLKDGTFEHIVCQCHHEEKETLIRLLTERYCHVYGGKAKCHFYATEGCYDAVIIFKATHECELYVCNMAPFAEGWKACKRNQ